MIARMDRSGSVNRRRFGSIQSATEVADSPSRSRMLTGATCVFFIETLHHKRFFFRTFEFFDRTGSVLIFLAHNLVDLAQMAKGIGLDILAAIDSFQKSTADSQA
jgi:hypothetical protein